MNLNLTVPELEILFNTLFEIDNPEAKELLSKIENLRTNVIDESVQILDKVHIDGDRGYVTGEIGGKMIVQVQGNTFLVDPKDLKEFNKKPEILVQPPMKFDEQTQKLLFEQYVKCGIFMDSTPIKVNDCFVKYSLWENATNEQLIPILIEGSSTFVIKSRIRIFENLNDFAGEDNYIPGVIIDEITEEVVENILLNAIDYSNAIGDADAVKIIKVLPDGTQEMQTLPRSSLRTLAV